MKRHAACAAIALLLSSLAVLARTPASSGAKPDPRTRRSRVGDVATYSVSGGIYVQGTRP